jgi:hypothetical protein
MARSQSPFMQHRHFKLIADIIRNMGAPTLDDPVGDIAMQFAMALEQTNPAFDRARFLAACQGNHTKSKDRM